MTTRRQATKEATMNNAETLQTIFDQIGKGFQPRRDPMQELIDGIEKCRKQIWSVAEDEKDKPLPNAKKIEEGSKRDAMRSPVRKPYLSPKKMGPSRVNLEYQVNAMKVVDLRQELKKRGLDQKGLKPQLRTRLLDAMMEENETMANEKQPPVHSQNATVKPCVKSPVVKPTNTQDEDVCMNDAESSKPDVEHIPAINVVEEKKETGEVPKPARVSCISTQADCHSEDVEMSESQVHHTGASGVKKYWKKLGNSNSVPKVATEPKEISGVPPTQAPVASQSSPVIEPAKKPVPEHAPMVIEKSDSQTEEDCSPPASEASSASSSCSKISGTRVRELVSKISSQSNFSSSSSTSQSALSKTLQAKKEMRMAKTAAIRVKSKPLTGCKKVALVPKEYTSALTSLNTLAASSSTKKKNLAQQMRVKAAEQMREKAAAVLRKENMPASNNQAVPLTTGKRNLPDPIQDTLGSTVVQGFSVKKSKVASPMETYEISDREDSDSDSDSETENDRKSKKAIPTWATRDYLKPALQQQYDGQINGKRVDPDDIFPEVQSCDLEAIFGSRKNQRYKNRTSSGNWTKDKVSAAEKLVYKRTMGFAQTVSKV